MKKRIKAKGLTIMILLVGSGAFAQHIQTQYFLNIPQSAQMNPAYRPDANLYIGLPLLSGAYFGMSNNLFDLSRFLQPMPGTDSVMTILHPDYDRDSFFRSIGRKGFVSTGLDVPILNLGLTVADVWWLEVGLALKSSASARLPADLFTLALEGNEDFVGSTASLSGTGFQAQAYLETYIGLSRNITDRLRVGGRLKIMQGALGASLVANDLEIQVNEDYSHVVDADLALKLNGPFDDSLNAEGFIADIDFREDFAFGDVVPSFRNTGLGLDLGAEYSLMENLKLSASIIDLGFIRWGKETYNYTASNEFTFEGIDITEGIIGDKDIGEIIEEFGDSLLQTFDFVAGDQAHTTWLPTKVYLAASYKPVDFLSLGLLSRTTIGMGVRESLTLSASLFAGDVLSTSISYTMTNRTYNNFGFGFGVRGGPVQFYAVIDQIPVAWLEFTGDGGNDRFVLPQRLDYINMRFGFNLMFGRAVLNRIDKPMLAE
ncbi:MAG: DUF5723 family protein [Bacteroidales bacterium]|nr:DUF5723 family protein [Bacteroidales bacterium]